MGSNQDKSPAFQKLPSAMVLFLWLNVLMAAALCASVITAKKIVAFGPLVFPCCNIIFSLFTFPVTDIISEIWGKVYARQAVYLAFTAQMLFVFFIQASIYLPFPEVWLTQEQYQLVLGSAPRVLLASMVAFLSAQMWDVFVYAKLKHFCKGKHLWLRNNLSTMTSQMLNSALFIGIAFYGVFPVWTLFVGSIGLKLLIALIDTPIVYIAVYYINRHLKGQTLAYTADE